ncbi:hypothetical protein EWM64_g8935 [Hericium alpestre]|uniref:Uncharacterized protein n=1 Tax=Hericium alpestre TaxID=135208 RepID=A0A4Y9ZLV1_9AGAM|nr:hypothetical protein EWM64_g8935 [Hericium alpestre]
MATLDPPFLDDDHAHFSEDVTIQDIVNKRPQPSSIAAKRIFVLVSWTWYYLAMPMLWETLVLDSTNRALQILSGLSGLYWVIDGADAGPSPARFVEKILCIFDGSVQTGVDMTQLGIFVSDVVRRCPNLALFASRGCTQAAVLRPIVDSLAHAASSRTLRKLDFGSSGQCLTMDPLQWNLVVELMGSTSVRTLVIPLDSSPEGDDAEPLDLRLPQPLEIYDASQLADVQTLVVTPRLFMCLRGEEVLPKLVDIHLFGVVVIEGKTELFESRIQEVPHLADKVRSMRVRELPSYHPHHFISCFRLLARFPLLVELCLELSEVYTYPKHLSEHNLHHPSITCMAIHLSRETARMLAASRYGISGSIRPEFRPMDHLARMLDVVTAIDLPNLSVIRLLGCSQEVILKAYRKEWTELLGSKGTALRWV